METLVGVLGTAVVGAVIAFATKMVQWSREDVKFYQDQVVPALASLAVIAETVKLIKEKHDEEEGDA